MSLGRAVIVHGIRRKRSGPINLPHGERSRGLLALVRESLEEELEEVRVVARSRGKRREFRARTDRPDIRPGDDDVRGVGASRCGKSLIQGRGITSLQFLELSI